jgi:hypothetical protein
LQFLVQPQLMQQTSHFQFYPQPFYNINQPSPMLHLFNHPSPMIDQSAFERSEMEKYAIPLQAINTKKDLIEYSNFLFKLHFYVIQF